MIVERVKEESLHCSRGSFLHISKVVVMEREFDEVATCVDRYLAKNVNAIIVPTELIR